LLLSGSIFIAILGVNPAIAQDNQKTLDVRLVSSTVKILSDMPAPGKSHQGFTITAVRNEYAPFQIVINSLKGVQEVSVAISDLRGKAASIKGPRTSLFLVENVTVKKSSFPSSQKPGVAGPQAWPDPLVPLGNLRVEELKLRSIWVDLFIPVSTVPDLYKGHVTVASQTGTTIELPVEIDVRDITIPTASTMKTAFGNLSLPTCMSKAHGLLKGSPTYQKALEDYYWFLVEHRLSPYSIPVDIYSKDAGRFLDDPRVTFFVIPMDWGAGKNSKIWNDDEMTRLSQRLDDTGWTGKGAFYVIDEPGEDAFADVVKIGKRVHSVNKSFKYLMTTDTGKILFNDTVMKEASVDIWVSLVRLMSDVKVRKVLFEERIKGKDLWWYTCIVPKWRGATFFIDDAATAPRLYPWMSHLYGIKGILYWAVDNWTHVDCNPWTNTETYPTGNGDGSLLYPDKDFARPVASIRLKMLREGLEDHELLTLLGEGLTRVAERIGGKAINYRPEERLFEHVLALITKEGRSFMGQSEIPSLMYATTNHEDIESRRSLVINEIENSQKAPLLLVLSSPCDNCFTTQDTAMISGFAQAGTTIEINGKIVLLEDKVFRTSVALVPGDNNISIKGTGTHGEEKERKINITRQ
jgi:hypothetical protein